MAHTRLRLTDGLGRTRRAYIGFSWTALLFGGSTIFPPITRLDWGGIPLQFLWNLVAVIPAMVLGAVAEREGAFFVKFFHASLISHPGIIAAAAWFVLFRILYAVHYNKWHLRRLERRGFVITASSIAVEKLGVESGKITFEDEDLYAKIHDEIEQKSNASGFRTGVWAQLFVAYDGDENKTRVAYIKTRLAGC